MPITISVLQPVPKSELVRLIEASLLLNNIVLVPAQEPNTVKVININTGKNPRSEGVRLFTGSESTPEGEQVISYYMPFKYISANEALTVFQTHILPRAYTSFVPINSAQALLITESTTVIRQLVALQELIDVPPARTVSEFVPLVRADAERVAETINKLMEYQRKERAGWGASSRGAWTARPRSANLHRSCGRRGHRAAEQPSPIGSRHADQPDPDDHTAEQNRVNLGSMRNTSSTSSTGGYSPVSGSAGLVGAGQDLLQEPNEQLVRSAGHYRRPISSYCGC
jgi:hypothetical protein